MTTITTEQIIEKIQQDLQPFWGVTSCPVPETHTETIKALIKAIELICKKTKIDKKYHVIISKSPFTVPLSGGKLIYEAKPETINATIDHIIFLDLEKLYNHKYQIKVACILEEFVHAVMNVQDECLTSQIVSFLYPEIQLNHLGQYETRENHEK